MAGVRITHSARVIFPDSGVTKADLAEYYSSAADRILPFLAGRPLSLVRCPEGAGKSCFFQKHSAASTPSEMKSVMIKEKDGTSSAYLMIDDQKGLTSAAQIGALELHLWGARSDDVERPERIVFDLDPDESLPFSRVRDAALELRAVLDAVGLTSFALLTGGKGVHVVVPLRRRRGWDDIKSFSRNVALALAEAAPDRYVAVMAKARRKGRIFIDYLRNERGATAIAPYSPRARSGAPIATPVSWSELRNATKADAWTLTTMRRRLASLRSDPWPDYLSLRQSITAAQMRAFARS